MNKIIKFAPMIREAIKNRIRELGLSQRKVAFDNGLSYNSFNDFLRGTRPFPLNDIEMVLRYLKLEIKK